MKTLKNIFFVTVPMLMVLLLILEVFFRFIIPASEAPTAIFDKNEKFILRDTNSTREGIYTIGKSAEIRSKWRVNNMGWNYPIDYFPHEKINDKKLIAVIGDSFIEAFQVNDNENYPYLLREKLKPEYEVYAFGMSGASLSQYLQYSRYVNKYINPDILVFNLVYNDFDESIAQLYPLRDYYQLSQTSDSTFTEIEPDAKSISLVSDSWIRKLLNKSALFRYLKTNLQAFQLFKTDPNKNKKDGTENAKQMITENNAVLPDDAGTKTKIFKATQYIFEKIRQENLGKRVIFVMDAPRTSIYGGDVNTSRMLWINAMVKTLCTENNFEHIDLTNDMNESYKANKIKFNSEIDGHWNQYGHKVVADVLYKYFLNNK